MDQKELSLAVKTIIKNVNDNGGEIDFEAINDILPKDMPIDAIENVIDLLFELKDEEEKEQVIETDQDQEVKSDESNALARYVQIVSGIQKLSAEQENEIIDTIEGGNNRAKTLLIEAYLPLVLNIARDKGSNRDEILDFIQDGNIALMTAVDNYKSNGNRTFRDYARWSIQKAITKSDRQASASLNLPKKITKFFREFKIISNGMKSRLNRLPELSEIASAMNMPQSEVQKNLLLGGALLDSDSTLDEENAAVIKYVKDVTAATEVKLEDPSKLHKVIRDNFELLSPVEKEVVSLYYGLEDGKTFDYVEIGEMLGMKSSMIRDLQSAALSRINISLGNAQV
ncbi:MAG: sigma-70 family RNA polymerase sigma factor [Candidatus Cloacimonetes bacterium]|nr:sigma-70 family RNA polymerase sigma factor [Candidatus Cloacimonadota bacterium]